MKRLVLRSRFQEQTEKVRSLLVGGGVLQPFLMRCLTSQQCKVPAYAALRQPDQVK